MEKRNRYTAIVPYFNNGPSVSVVISALRRIPAIKQIILVDDGSQEKARRYLGDLVTSIRLVELPKNLGKAGAVESILKEIREPNVFLIDADLVGVKAAELEKALEIYRSHPELDALVLRIHGMNDVIDSILRKDIALTGTRLVSMDDLRNSFSLRPKGYQFENAMNEYLLRNKRNVKWLPTTFYNPHKIEKFGLLEGVKKDFTMDLQLVRFLGLGRYLYQLCFFARRQFAE